MKRWMQVCVLWAFWFSLAWSAQARKVDTIRLKQKGVLKVGRQPKQIGVSLNSTKAYVTDFGGKTVTVLDLKHFRVSKTLKTGGAAVELAFTPDGKHVFVTDFWGGVWKIEVATDKILKTIKGKRFPKGVAVSPNGKKVYFSSWRWPRGVLTELDVKTGKRLRRIRVWNRPRGMAISKNGRWLYLCHFGGSGAKKENLGLAKISTRTLKKEWMVISGFNARHVVLSNRGRHVYVSNMGSSVIGVLSARTGKLLRRIVVGKHPKTIDLMSNDRYLFSANYDGRSISVVDLKYRREIQRIPMPDRISGLDVSPDNRYVYVTGWDTGRVWRFQIEKTTVDRKDLFYSVRQRRAQHTKNRSRRKRR